MRNNRLLLIALASCCATLVQPLQAQSVRWSHRTDSGVSFSGFAPTPAGDYNGDGFADYINFGTATTVHSGNDGTVLGFFSPSFGGFAVADTNADGLRDLVLIPGPTFSNVELRTNAAIVWSTPRNSSQIAPTGDLNGDGYDDVALYGSIQSTLTVLSGIDGTTLGTWTAPPFEDVNRVLAIGDVDNDGRDNLAVRTSDSYAGTDTVHVLRGNLSTLSSFIDPWNDLHGNEDLDGDGIDELLFRSGSNLIATDRNGTVVATGTPPAGSASGSFGGRGAGDVDGDGFGDVLVYDLVFYGPDLTRFDEVGRGRFGMGDSNGDGFDDVLGADGVPGSPVVWTREVFETAAIDTRSGPTGQAVAMAPSFSSTTPGPVYAITDSILGAPVISGSGNIIARLIHAPGRDLDFVRDMTGDGLWEAVAGLPTIDRVTWRADGVSRYTEDPGSGLGTSFGDAGDVNNDGVIDVVLGAPTGGSNSAGQFKIWSGDFLANFSGPEFFGTIDALPADLDFGAAVDGVGDLNGDGFDDVLVGAPRAMSANPEGGKAFVYSGAWLTNGTGPLTLFGIQYNQNNAHYGAVVRGLGDTNGDGVADFAIAAPDLDVNGNTDAGTLWIHSGADNSILLAISGTAPNLHVGASIDSAGDFDDDGNLDVVFGYPGWDNDRGAIEVWSIARAESLLFVEGNNVGDLFGTSVAGGHDMTGDGTPDLLAGAPATPTQGYNELIGAVANWPMATLSIYGAGCPDTGSGQQPRIGAASPAFLGEPWEITARALPPGSVTFNALGLVPASIPILGCTQLVDSIATRLIFPIPLANRASRSLTIPNDASFLGLPLASQWFVLTGTLSMSEGIATTVGQRPN